MALNNTTHEQSVLYLHSESQQQWCRPPCATPLSPKWSSVPPAGYLINIDECVAITFLHQSQAATKCVPSSNTPNLSDHRAPHPLYPLCRSNNHTAMATPPAPAAVVGAFRKRDIYLFDSILLRDHPPINHLSHHHHHQSINIAPSECNKRKITSHNVLVFFGWYDKNKLNILRDNK